MFIEVAWPIGSWVRLDCLWYENTAGLRDGNWPHFSYAIEVKYRALAAMVSRVLLLTLLSLKNTKSPKFLA